MNYLDTSNYAKTLLEALGARAELHAAQQVSKFEAAENQEQAERWRSIRTAILQRKASTH